MEKVVRTICQGCHSECGILVRVAEGKVTRMTGDPEPPVSRGHICVKGKNYAEFLYHPDRLKHPLKRAGEKGGGKWQRVSWDEALDDIAARLTETRETYGRESIATLNGTAPRASLFSTNFLAGALGTPNTVSTDLHICYAPLMVAEICTVGGPVMQEVGPDYRNAKCMFVCGGNPVVNMQNTRRTWEAFKQLDLFVVADFFMTPTAELADYVLPAATWLERDECCDQQYMGCVAARQRAVEPLFETRNDIQMVMDLVRRIPWADRNNLPWDDVEAFNGYRVEGMGMTFEEFKEKGYVSVPWEYEQYKREPLNTPTGKVELYSTIFEKHGHDPLPVFVEPPQSPVSTPELVREYPLILITGARYIEYFHSEGRQISSLRKRVPDPEVEMHPDTAGKANLQEGDWVWIETPQVRGERVRFKVKFAPNIDPRVVNAAHGCFDSNIDVVMTDDSPREKICGSVPTRGTLCKVYK